MLTTRGGIQEHIYSKKKLTVLKGERANIIISSYNHKCQILAKKTPHNFSGYKTPIWHRSVAKLGF